MESEPSCRTEKLEDNRLAGKDCFVRVELEAVGTHPTADICDR